MSRVRELHSPITVKFIEIDMSGLTAREAWAQAKELEERAKAAKALGLELPPDPRQGVRREETRCAHCYGDLGRSLGWSCPTILALDQPVEPT